MLPFFKYILHESLKSILFYKSIFKKPLFHLFFSFLIHSRRDTDLEPDKHMGLCQDPEGLSQKFHHCWEAKNHHSSSIVGDNVRIRHFKQL